jgi:hypothetical protein
VAWAEDSRAKASSSVIRDRLNAGWSVQAAITTPTRGKKHA